MRYRDLSHADCAIAQALAVVGDWWSLLIVRDVAGGATRFDELQHELGVSRKVLAERLKALVADGVLDRSPYQLRPERHEYRLTEKGRALLPVLIALQDWGARHVMGDGSLTATADEDSDEARRVRALVGTPIAELTVRGSDGAPCDPLADGRWTVLACLPGVHAAAPPPPQWDVIPGARGCTVQALALRDGIASFAHHHAEVRGISTQRPDELAVFADRELIPFALLSDVAVELATSLRLPTFRVDGVDRLKRLTLIVDPDRVIRAVQYPIVDPDASAGDTLALLIDARSRALGAPTGRRRRTAPGPVTV